MGEKSALVSRILNFSCVDGPGNRLVIFLQGCNFDCLNCHNPHTINNCNHCGDCVDSCPTQALAMVKNKVVWDEVLCTHCDKCIDICGHKSSPKIKRYNVTQILELIRSQHFFISGITVSGGEATLQLPFIIALFRAIKADRELGHLTCFIDSNGYLPVHAWEKVTPVLDGVMLDLKSWQSETHRWLTRRDNHRVVDSIRYLANAKKLHELRLLHIPGKSDLDSEIDEVVNLIRSLPADVVVRLNAFQHHGVRGQALEWEKCSEDEMNRFRSLIVDRIVQPILTPTIYT